MLQVELKKILFHHKGLLLLLIALAAYAVFCVGSGYDSSYVIDRNEDTYLTTWNAGKVRSQRRRRRRWRRSTQKPLAPMMAGRPPF